MSRIPAARGGRTGRNALLAALLLCVLLASGGSWAGAEGSFQVRYFLPAEPWYSGLSADLNWRGELPPELYGGQLDAKFSVSGLERQSLSATYSRERTVVLAQYDRSESVYGAGSRSDQTALLFAQQGFDSGDGTSGNGGLKQVGLTALYTDSSTPEYAYRVISADLNAGGQFSPTLSWTLGSGITRSDSGLSTDFTSGSLSERVRAGLTERWTGELPASLGVQASYNATQSRTAGSGGAADTEADSGTGNLSLTGNVALSSQENLSGNACVDTGGSYGADLSLSSTRLEGWTLGAGLNLNGQFGGAAPGLPVPVTYGWNASAALTPKPWGVRLTYSGSSGENGRQSLDAEGQYQEGALSAQAGAGVTFQSGVQVAPDGTLTPTIQPAYRASLGVSARSEAQPPGAGSATSAPSAFQIQARLNVSASPVLNPQGALEYRYGGALSGTLSYTSGPFQAEVNSSLNYAGYTPQQPWSGEFGVQALYSFSDALQLNVSGRYRPASLSAFQAGLGLRYRF